MDYSAPIARRTRSREAEYFRTVYQELQKKKKKKGKGKVGNDESSGNKSVGDDDDDNVDKSSVKGSGNEDLEGCFVMAIDEDFDEEDGVGVGHRKDVSKINVAKKGKQVLRTCEDGGVKVVEERVGGEKVTGGEASVSVIDCCVSVEESSTTSSGSDGDSDSTYESKKQSSDEDEDVDVGEDEDDDDDDDEEEEEEEEKRCTRRKQPSWANVSTPAQAQTHCDVGSGNEDLEGKGKVGSGNEDLEGCVVIAIDGEEVGHKKDASKKNMKSNVAKKGKQVSKTCDINPVDDVCEDGGRDVVDKKVGGEKVTGGKASVSVTDCCTSVDELCTTDSGSDGDDLLDDWIIEFRS